MQDLIGNQLPFVLTFSIIYDLFRYFIFCIFVSIVDVLTVLKLKDTFREKSRLTTMDQKKEEQAAKAELRSIVD